MSVLFCVYMDGLIACSKPAAVGCYVGHMLNGDIAYAYDTAQASYICTSRAADVEDL